MSIEGSQIATSIDEKLCLGNIVFLGETVAERRRGQIARWLYTSTSKSSFDSVPMAA
ncbi:hypothetical protein MBEHAL_0608 [Halarchaeum acidiphilum MH1-52-1]|uniref:Uncharacterized protein n=1 Tax=Halarchaeum acidiphilum MH1-52-1 TaxID=1261545 RepID=U3AAS9_9EURY|nr:hypothetical protein MBEHAL_0608 [Halarchaeum acidiphilum MH1-52-1]